MLIHSDFVGGNMEDKFLLIIDGSSLLSTQFYGNLPREILFAKTQEEKEKYYYKIMQNSKGVYTNAVYGFFRTLLRIIKDQKPSHNWNTSLATGALDRVNLVRK